MGDVTVRPITDVPTLRAVESLQRQVWRMPDLDVVPSHQLVAANSSGGAVLGAFDPDGRLVGFCYGFVGLREGTPLFYSHMAGVLEDWRGQDVGFQLKQAQRDAALARGLEWMVWTYDPLQSANAYFNLHKLGASARRYLVNYYGDMPDELNRGVESDRLEVDWHLRAPRVTALMATSAPPVGDAPPWERARHSGAVLVAAQLTPLPVPADPLLDLDAPVVWLGIPADFHGLRRHNLGLAQEWRALTRRAFLTYLDRGYEAVDFVRTPPMGYYVLRRFDAR